MVLASHLSIMLLERWIVLDRVRRFGVAKSITMEPTKNKTIRKGGAEKLREKKKKSLKENAAMQL